MDPQKRAGVATHAVVILYAESLTAMTFFEDRKNYERETVAFRKQLLWDGDTGKRDQISISRA